MEANFQNLFLDIHQAQRKLATVYTRDACNRDLCQVVRYYGCRYTSIISGGGLAPVKLGKDLRIPLDCEKCENYIPMKNTRYMVLAEKYSS